MADTSETSVTTAQVDGHEAVVTRYSTVAVVLHWLIALLLLGNIAIAWTAEYLPRAEAGRIMGWHMSDGILILLLSLLRLGWRLIHPVPPFPAGLPQWEKTSARLVHWGFYVIMIGMPLTGWIMTSGPRAKGAIMIYGLIPWPLLPFVHHAQGEVARLWHALGETHGVLAYFAYALIVLHVGAALKHQFVDRDVLMARMAPFLGRRRPTD
jgi:cytochrome b561